MVEMVEIAIYRLGFKLWSSLCSLSRHLEAVEIAAEKPMTGIDRSPYQSNDPNRRCMRRLQYDGEVVSFVLDHEDLLGCLVSPCIGLPSPLSEPSEGVLYGRLLAPI